MGDDRGRGHAEPDRVAHRGERRARGPQPLVDELLELGAGVEATLALGELHPRQPPVELVAEELARVRVFCDDWEQASHNGDLVHALEAAVLTREDVAQLGDVLIGTAEGRKSDRDITIFDSTGLAIQDLAIALAAIERADELDLSKIEL